jgi:hypothetical protein
MRRTCIRIVIDALFAQYIFYGKGKEREIDKANDGDPIGCMNSETHLRIATL